MNLWNIELTPEEQETDKIIHDAMIHNTIKEILKNACSDIVSKDLANSIELDVSVYNKRYKIKAEKGECNNDFN